MTKKNYIFLTLTIFLGFLIFGFSENIKGPAIPRLQADFAMNEFRLGLLLATNSLGYLAACFYTASLSRKIGLKQTLIVCLIGMTASGAAICFSPNYPALLASYFIMYLGNGMLEISLGIMAATTFTRNTGTMMNLSHFFYGLSSCAAPVMATSLMNFRFGGNALGWRKMYMLVLLLSLIPIIPSAMVRIKKATNLGSSTGYKAFLKNKYTLPIIIILSLSVSCELCVGGWLVNFMEKSRQFDESSAALALTAFFVTFTLARLVLGPLIDKIGYIKSLFIFTAFSSLTIITGVLLGNRGNILLIAAGFGIAPIYPTVMALLAKLFPDNIESAMTVTLTVMGITIVISNLSLGIVIDLLRSIFAPIMGENSIGFAYSVGYIIIGLFCLGAFFITFLLYKQMKPLGKL